MFADGSAVQVSPHVLDLPPNTLLVTLTPPGTTYYLPSVRMPLPRPRSPSVGYSSDPEFASKKIERGDFASDSTVVPLIEPFARESVGSRMGHNTNVGTNTPVKAVTHSYPQLFEYVFHASYPKLLKMNHLRLVNLQSLIRDHEMSLLDLVQKIDKHLEEDRVFPLVCTVIIA